MHGTDTFLGRLGDRDGINVAKVEVSWYYEWQGEHGGAEIEVDHGFYLVHATGDEPECEGEDGTIYAVFEGLVHGAMEKRQERLGFAGYEIDDISAA